MHWADRSPNARRWPSSRTAECVSSVGSALPRRPLFPSNAPRLMKTQTPVVNQLDRRASNFKIQTSGKLQASSSNLASLRRPHDSFRCRQAFNGFQRHDWGGRGPNRQGPIAGGKVGEAIRRRGAAHPSAEPGFGPNSSRRASACRCQRAPQDINSSGGEPAPIRSPWLIMKRKC